MLLSANDIQIGLAYLRVFWSLGVIIIICHDKYGDEPCVRSGVQFRDVQHAAAGVDPCHHPAHAAAQLPQLTRGDPDPLQKV